jgi:hypothetical protein
MDKELLKQVLIKNTANIFNPEWYEKVSLEIMKMSQDEQVGYVYFAKPRKSPFIKIGMSYNVKERIRALESQFGIIDLIGFIYVPNYKALEKETHNYYRDKNVSGEWFDINVNEAKNYILAKDGKYLNIKASDCLIDQGCVLNTEQRNDNEILKILLKIPFNEKIQLTAFKNHFASTRLAPNKLLREVEKVADTNNIFLTKPRSNGIRYVVLENK